MTCLCFLCHILIDHRGMGLLLGSLFYPIDVYFLCFPIHLSEKCFSFFPVEYINFEYIIYSLYYVKLCFLYFRFAKGFYHEWVLDFMNFLLLYLLICSHNLLLSFVVIEYSTNWFVHIVLKLHPRNKSVLIKEYDLFNLLSSFVYLYLIEHLCT